MSDKLPWDADCSATRAGMERFLRALVCVGGHFTDSFTLAPVTQPTRSVSVFFRIWLPQGCELRFLEMANIDELKPPPRVQVGLESPPDDGRRPILNPAILTARAAAGGRDE